MHFLYLSFILFTLNLPHEIEEMAIAVTMPKMSDTMTEGVIASWLVKVGDTVESGDIVAEVETDKATMELENYEDGVILHLAVGDGGAVPIDGLVYIIGEKGEDFKTILEEFVIVTGVKDDVVEETSQPIVVESAPVLPAVSPVVFPRTTEPEPSRVSSHTNGRVKASPLARKMANEKGIDISNLSGTGDGGRIVKRDIEDFKVPAFAPTVVAPIGSESHTDYPLSQMRKTIARRLGESKFTAPHFYLTIELSMDGAMEARAEINEVAPVKISYNDMVVKASAMALRKHPKVNSSWLGDVIRTNDHIHVGVAIAVEEGLLVPVVRFADSKQLSQISAEVKDFAARARDKTLQPEDWAGNTFTISNLGMMGIEEFTAIINPPDACIMAVGTIVQKPIVRAGEIVVGHTMKVTLSCDHRAVDGATGAAFLQSFREYIENPVTMLA